MQTDDIIFPAIEKCAVDEVRDNFVLNLKAERDHVQGKLDHALCSTSTPEIVIDIEKLFQDMTEDEIARRKSEEIASQEWVFPSGFSLT